MYYLLNFDENEKSNERHLLERFRCPLLGPLDMYRDSSYMLREEPSPDKGRPIGVINYELEMGSFKTLVQCSIVTK